jgi:Ca2+-binding RTX toxin-like protein
MLGGAGDDTYFVDAAGDQVLEAGGQGHDTVFTSVSYTLSAGTEIELLATTDGELLTAINLTGNDLANELWGNAGANRLNGGGGNDVLYGFGGADSYVFSTTLGGNNVDFLADFSGVGSDGDDRILLDHNVFAGLGLGALSSDAFVVGSAAQDADDRIIFDSATGAIYFDADGNGAGLAIQFARIDTSTPLTASDFTVI